MFCFKLVFPGGKLRRIEECVTKCTKELFFIQIIPVIFLGVILLIIKCVVTNLYCEHS